MLSEITHSLKQRKMRWKKDSVRILRNRWSQESEELTAGEGEECRWSPWHDLAEDEHGLLLTHIPTNDSWIVRCVTHLTPLGVHLESNWNQLNSILPNWSPN